MKRAKYLFIFFIGTLTYVLLSMTIGQNSISCFKQLTEQKRILSTHEAKLENINGELTLEVNALKFDKEVIAAYARKLDYVSDGEKLVKINGLQRSEPPLFNTGTVLKHMEPSYLSEDYCKMFAIIISLLTFIVLFLYDIGKGNISFEKKEKTYVTGIPVYDFQQI